MDSKMMKNLATIVGILVVLHLIFSTNETDISSQEKESVCIRTTEELPEITESEEMPAVEQEPAVQEERVVNISGYSGDDSISSDFVVEGFTGSLTQKQDASQWNNNSNTNFAFKCGVSGYCFNSVSSQGKRELIL